MAERARRLARDKYDWNVVGRLACDAVAGAVRRTPAPEDRLADVPMPISVATP
jgi:hypothetical protein